MAKHEVEQVRPSQELTAALAAAAAASTNRVRVREAIQLAEGELSSLQVRRQAAVDQLAHDEASIALGQPAELQPLSRETVLSIRDSIDLIEIRIAGLRKHVGPVDQQFLEAVEKVNTLIALFAQAHADEFDRRYRRAVEQLEPLLMEGLAVRAAFRWPKEQFLKTQISEFSGNGSLISFHPQSTWGQEDAAAQEHYAAIREILNRGDALENEAQNLKRQIEAKKPKPTPRPEPQSMVTVSAAPDEEYQSPRPRKDFTGDNPGWIRTFGG